MYFYINSFSIQLIFKKIEPLYFHADVYMYTCFRCARNRYIMQIYFAGFCRGQSVTAAKHALCAPYAHFSL